jgi:hypothetical protein
MCAVRLALEVAGLDAAGDVGGALPLRSMKSLMKRLRSSRLPLTRDRAWLRSKCSGSAGASGAGSGATSAAGSGAGAASAGAAARWRLHPPALPSPRPAGDEPEELVLVDGLGEHVVHPGGHHPLPLVVHGVGGEGHHGQLGVFGLDDGGGLVAVHHRHLQVEQHEVEVPAAHGLDGLLAVVGEGQAGGGHLDEGGAHLAVEVVVVDQQEVLAVEPGDRRGVAFGAAGAGLAPDAEGGSSAWRTPPTDTGLPRTWAKALRSSGGISSGRARRPG